MLRELVATATGVGFGIGETGTDGRILSGGHAGDILWRSLLRSAIALLRSLASKLDAPTLTGAADGTVGLEPTPPSLDGHHFAFG
jgi:hypothetical protein